MEKWNALQRLKKKILDTKRKPIAVLAPSFNSENITDGYFQRIYAIDHLVLENYYRIYFRLQEDYTAPILHDTFQIDELDDFRTEVSLDPRVFQDAYMLYDLCLWCKMVYIHCALRIIQRSTGKMLRNALCNIFLVWDVHGVVPEEFAMHGDYWGAQEAGEAEHFLACHADIIVSVNSAMRDHLCNKYPQLNGKHIILPIFSIKGMQFNRKDLEKEKYLSKEELPIAVYAGGLQKWQQIETMQTMIEKQKDICRYWICVPHPEKFMDMWGNKMQPPYMWAAEKKPEELSLLYKKCHYGFAIRNSDIVNAVACPTKIIEYLQYGIIPILDNPNLGDFKKFGLKYLSSDKFENGELLSETKRKIQARKNFRVLKKIQKQSKQGIFCLKAILERPNVRNKKRQVSLGPAIAVFYSKSQTDCQKTEHIMKQWTKYHFQGKRVFLLCDTLDLTPFKEKIAVEWMFGICALEINGIFYGGSKKEFLDFCYRQNIQVVLTGEEKQTVEQFADKYFESETNST